MGRRHTRSPLLFHEIPVGSGGTSDGLILTAFGRFPFELLHVC